jgi:hypothetical protein
MDKIAEEPKYEKVDQNTLKIIKEVPVKTLVSTYIYEDLEVFLENLLSEKEKYNLTIDKTIAEAEEAIRQADLLGITKKEVALPPD